MKRRELLVVFAASAMSTVGAVTKSEAQQNDAHYGNDTALPEPKLDGPVSLEAALARRRSVRRFASTPLPAGTIGQLLWAGQGITSEDGKRAAPSAGALFALDLYAVTASEVMHYVPQGHRAQTRATSDLRPQLSELAVGQASVTSAPVVIAIAADASRLAARYGARANPYAELEAAHAAQNMLLQAAALGLAAVPVGAVDGPRAARALSLPASQSVVYLIPVGYRA